MRLIKTCSLLAATALAALPLPVLAQDADSDYDAPEIGAEDMGALTEALSDPAMQEKLAIMMRAMTGMMMDMNVAPIARAAAEMAGEDPEAIDPDTTLRELAGEEAEDMPARMQEELPEMMQRMAGMSGMFEQMLPLLREMAEGMGETMAESAN